MSAETEYEVDARVIEHWGADIQLPSAREDAVRADQFLYS